MVSSTVSRTTNEATGMTSNTIEAERAVTSAVDVSFGRVNGGTLSNDDHVDDAEMNAITDECVHYKPLESARVYI